MQARIDGQRHCWTLDVGGWTLDVGKLTGHILEVSPVFTFLAGYRHEFWDDALQDAVSFDPGPPSILADANRKVPSKRQA